MNAPSQSPTDIPAAEAAFFKRKRIARVAEFVVFILLFSGIPLLSARWRTLTEWSFWLGLPIAALYLWSARCTICGGGIKLNGRTCARCGHVFSSPAQRLRSLSSRSPEEPLNPA